MTKLQVAYKLDCNPIAYPKHDKHRNRLWYFCYDPRDTPEWWVSPELAEAYLAGRVLICGFANKDGE